MSTSVKIPRLLVFLLALASSVALCGAYPTGITQILWGTRAYYGSTGAGNVTISTNTTLSADIFYQTLTVNTGKVLSTAGFRIYADTIILNGTANIDNSGGGNVGALTGSLCGGTFAGNGGTTGSNGTNQSAAVFGNLSGAGGAGGSPSGGAAGTNTTLGATYGRVQAEPFSVMGWAFGAGGLATVCGGTGGGGGGGAASGPGAGGGGGGVVVISARSLQGTGSITATGGLGTNSTASGNEGGGGGGGGGVIFLNVGDFSQWSGTTSVAGGAGGTGHGTGTSGSTGSAGTVVTIYG
jgi:hypothetical protein